MEETKILKNYKVTKTITRVTRHQAYTNVFAEDESSAKDMVGKLEENRGYMSEINPEVIEIREKTSLDIVE